MKPDVKEFTRDDPCTKLHIWNCFRAAHGFKRVQLDEAWSEIGVNAPRNMLKKGYIEIKHAAQEDYYQLTNSGEEWLRKGVKSYIRKHPDERKNAVLLPRRY